jgi:raffinose/stachyose/melibiose transport system substrate-binding protein
MSRTGGAISTILGGNMKKNLIICLLIIIAGSMVFAGGNGESSATDAEDTSKAMLNFWSWRTEDVDTYNELIDIFEAKNPGINVNFTAYKNTEYNTVLSAAMKGFSGPDIIHLRAYGGLETYAKPGYLMPLEDKVPELSGFSETAIGGVTSASDGEMYGVPFASQTLVIYYNKAIYTELGLEVPETWDEFLANLAAVKAAGYAGLANGGKDGWTLEVLQGVICPNFYGANDYFNEVVSGDTNFTDDRYRSSLEKLLELRPYMPDNFMGIAYTDMQMLFINEMAGHFIGGSWEAGYFSKENPDMEFDVFAGPVAKKGDTRYVSAFVDGSFGMSAYTKNSEEATKFLRFMASAEAGQFLADKLRQKSDVPDVVFADPFLKKVGELNLNSTPYIMLVGFRYEQPTGSALVQSTLQGMMADSIDSHEVVRQVQEGVATWYKPFQN